MNYINIYGLVFILVIMIPNIVFAIKNKDGFCNAWRNRVAETFEKIGRFGCLGLMVLVIPGCGFGFSSDKAFAAYIILDILLSAAYCLLWIVLFRNNNVFRALALSVIPSLLFLVSGVLSHYWPLCIAAAVFAPSHIAVSYKNAVLETQR